MKKLSIIVPVYNTREPLKKCLDSLINQTHRNIEIIVVDDASTENILDIINTCKYDIQYIRNTTNLGPGGARNIGLQNATGDYIAFCDSDDWYDITLVEDSINAMVNNDAQIGMLTVKRSYDNAYTPTVFKCEYDRVIELSGIVAFRIMTKEYDFGIKIVPLVTNKIYNHDFLLENNLLFEENRMFEDLLYSAKCLLRANKIITIPNVRYHHYRRTNSIVQSFSKKHVQDMFYIFSQIENTLKTEELYHTLRKSYYLYIEHFYNLLIRQIYEFIPNEDEKKHMVKYVFQVFKETINYNDYLEIKTSEEIRRHIQPHIENTDIK